MSIHPFTINIPQATLDDLHERISRIRWPDEVESAGWDYGVSGAGSVAYIGSPDVHKQISGLGSIQQRAP